MLLDLSQFYILLKMKCRDTHIYMKTDCLHIILGQKEKVLGVEDEKSVGANQNFNFQECEKMCLGQAIKNQSK